MIKKIISLIASISMIATMMTAFSIEVSAANAPVFDTTITEMSASEYKDNMGVDLGEGLKAYWAVTSVSGLDLSVKASGTNLATKKLRDGVVAMAMSYTLNFDNVANIAELVYADGNVVSYDSAANSYKLYMNANDISQAYPTTTDGNTTAVTATSIDNLGTYLIVVKGDVIATPSAEFKATAITSSALGESEVFQPDQITYTTNGVANSTVKFAGATQETKEFETVTGEQAVAGTNATEGKYASTDGTMKALKHIANVLENADATKKIRIIKTLNGVSETMETQRTISDVLGGVAVENSKINAKVAIGVLTADTDAVFTFELF